MNEYHLQQAWLLLSGAPYPVRGYYDMATHYREPGFERLEMETVVDLINRRHIFPVYEWEGSEVHPTEEGRDAGYRVIIPNRSKQPLELYWVPAVVGDVWRIVERPSADTFNLEFQSMEDTTFVAYGSGPTLIQALADLERELIRLCSPEAAFHKSCCFLNRDIVTLVEDLDEIGGVFSCSDFSSPEESFVIRRIPSIPTTS